MGKRKEPPRLAVRLTESEKKKIEAAAAKCGLTVSEYMRQRALGYERLDARFIGTPNLAASQKEELCVITCRDSSCSSKHPYDGREIGAVLSLNNIFHCFLRQIQKNGPLRVVLHKAKRTT